ALDDHRAIGSVNRLYFGERVGADVHCRREEQTLRLPIVRDRELVDGDVLEVVRFDVADKPAERVGIRFEAVDLAQSANALPREQSVLSGVCADVEAYVSGFESLLEEVYGLGFVAPVRAYAAANRIVPRHSDLEPVSERRPPRDAIAKP